MDGLGVVRFISCSIATTGATAAPPRAPHYSAGRGQSSQLSRRKTAKAPSPPRKSQRRAGHWPTTLHLLAGHWPALRPKRRRRRRLPAAHQCPSSQASLAFSAPWGLHLACCPGASAPSMKPGRSRAKLEWAQPSIRVLNRSGRRAGSRGPIQLCDQASFLATGCSRRSSRRSSQGANALWPLPILTTSFSTSRAVLQ